MEDQEILFKAQKGDEESFAFLLTKYRPKILTHCISLIHDESQAEDVLQEAAVKAFKNLNQFKAKSSFGTWLWRIAHNLCIDYLRKNKEVTIDSIEIIKDNTPVPGLDEWKDHLNTLSFKHRQVIEAYYIERLSQKEIAHQLGIPLGTVRSRLFYARKYLCSRMRYS